MRLSASKINSLDQCSYKFYLNYVLGNLPEKPHPKTNAGTVAHAIFEVITAKKRKNLLEELKNHKFDIFKFPSLSRYYWKLIKQYNINEEVTEGIPPMLELGLEHVYHVLKNTEIESYHAEYEFLLKEADYEIKGFIDLLIFFKNGKTLIIDYKSQSQKFTKEKMDFNIQALVYQLAVNKIFKRNSDVDFVLLRYPPTKRKPDNHIQPVNFVGQDELSGVESYLGYIQKYIDSFDEKAATSNFCDKFWFCKHVCQFQYAFNYFQVNDENGKFVKSFFEDEDEALLKLVQENPTYKVEYKSYEGCPKFKRGY